MADRLTGSCHCGAVTLRIPWNGAFDKPRSCDCSFCSRRSAVAASVKLADLEILSGADNLTRYTFGSGTAQHFFCATCGIYTHHQRRSDPSEYGVNVANFEGVDMRDFADVPFVDGRNHPNDR